MNRGNKEAAWAARGLTAAALIIVGIWVCVVFAYGAIVRCARTGGD